MQPQQDYLLTFHKNHLNQILENEDISSHFAININFIVLYEHQPQLIVELLQDPERCLEVWDEAVLKVQLSLLKEGGSKYSLKSNVHCRIYHLPGLPEVCRIFFPSIEDAGKFLQVSGTVMSISPIKLLQYQRNYICTKCKYQMLVTAEYERKYIIKQPKKCGNPDFCPGINFMHIAELDSEYCKDFQQIKIQEQIKKLGVGSMPNTMWVTLEDDLVDTCKPGDNVTICGIVKKRWGEFSKGNKIDIDIVLKANNVQVDSNATSGSASVNELREMFSAFWNKYSEDPLAGRNLILKSFCPQIYGLYLVKLAIATVLAGGCQIEDTTLTGVCTRSESHLLLVGDPGTGKSQLLRFASKIIPRAVLTTGVGSSAAGLTVAAIMEHGEWHLEGGALVMSDGGVCCIDEFNSMKEHDRTSLHEAMEQQTISVAKASIVCKLNTRCSILAACNPKGNLDLSNPLCMNIALPSPLLSRFDLILLLRDTVNQQWDNQVADYILNGRNTFSKLTDSDLWSTDILQSYFVTIKKINPKLSEDAEIILSSYYQMQRRVDSRNKARTTIRLLESLIRLSQGHARLMFHSEVEIIDSIYAVVLVDAAMDNDASILNLNIDTRNDFPDQPTNEYLQILETVLSKLRLHDILQREIELMGSTKGADTLKNVMSRFFNAEVLNKNEDINLADIITSLQVNVREQSCKDDKKRKIGRDVDNSTKKIKKVDEVVNENKQNCAKSSEQNQNEEQNKENKNIPINGNGKSEIKNEKSPSKPRKELIVNNKDLPCSDTSSSITCSNLPDKVFKDNSREKSNVDNSSKQKDAKTKKIAGSLKKFKFVPRDINKASEEAKVISKNIFENCSPPGNKNSPKKPKKRKNDPNDFLKEDLEMLKRMPSINDDFDINLDINWDNGNNV